MIERFLVLESYWAQDRPRPVIETSIQHSICLGIYHHGRQVAFARLVTDQSTFAWLADVFVVEGQRGQGLGKWIVQAACSYADLLNIDLMVLSTRDAQKLYETYGGFHPLNDPSKWLNRMHPDRD